MGYLLLVLGFLGVFVGFVLLIIGLIIKKKMKGGLVLGISAAAFIVGFIMVPTNSTESADDSNNEESVEQLNEETSEEKAAREAKEAEEKVAAELKTTEEAKAKIKAEAETRVKAEQEEKARQGNLVNEATTWQNKVKEIASNDGTPTDKYDAIMLYAKEYPATELEIKEFEKYIITEYQNKKYIANINNAEYMIGNIFRANVINRYYGEVYSPMNDFAFDFYQNTKYTYRGVDAIDSDAVRSNERQMDKALAKMK